MREAAAAKRKKDQMRSDALARQSQEERVRSFASADQADLPHARFMAPPSHPTNIVDNEHAESYKRLLQKPAGDGKGGERQGTAKARAAYSRKLRQWKRNGQKGEMPKPPASTDAGAPSLDEFSASPAMQATHRARYARWCTDHLRQNGVFGSQQERSPSQLLVAFTFNVMADPWLSGTGPSLDVVVMMVDRVVYTVSTQNLSGINEAIACGEVRLLCTPDNVVTVLDGGEPPREARTIQLAATDVVSVVGKEFYKRGIPCGLVLEDRPWPESAGEFPVTLARLPQE